MTRGGKTYYYHFNAHGDTIALTDDSGNIAACYTYDIWGNIISKEGDIANPFTYGGQWGYIHDDESGLYFLKTRYYDPLIGRFISRDRFAGFENDPDSQNRYVYCGNDPVNNVDPDGENPINFFALAGGLVIIDGPLPFGDIVALTIAAYGTFLLISNIVKSIKIKSHALRHEYVTKSRINTTMYNPDEIWRKADHPELYLYVKYFRKIGYLLVMFNLSHMEVTRANFESTKLGVIATRLRLGYTVRVR